MEHESTGYPALHVDDAVDQARLCLEKETTERAARTLRALRRRFPDEARLWRLEGIAAQRSGRPLKAEHCYRRAVDLRPDEPEYALDLAELLLYRGRASQKGASQKREADCRSLLRLAEATAPRNPRVHGLWGLLAAKEGRFADAERQLRLALELDPSYAWAARELSDVFLNSGRETEAHRVIVSLLDRDPIDPRNHGYLGELLERRGLIRQAMTAYRTALWLKADYAWAACRLVRILRRRKRHAEARDVLRDVLEAAPREPRLWMLLAAVEQHLGNAVSAQRCYRAALRLDPRSVQAFRGLFALYLAMGRIDAARRLLWDRLLGGSSAPSTRRGTRFRPRES